MGDFSGPLGPARSLKVSGPMIDFPTAPQIGTLLMLDNQAYELREARPASRNDGSPTMLLDWETQCPACGGPFTVTTGLKTKAINRRCRGCLKPHKPVTGKRGRKVQVRIIEP